MDLCKASLVAYSQYACGIGVSCHCPKELERISLLAQIGSVMHPSEHRTGGQQLLSLASLALG